MLRDDRTKTPTQDYVPRRIVRMAHGWGILHGSYDDLVLPQKTIRDCFLKIIEWKQQGLCESWHVDNLFLFDAIEW